MEPVTIVGSIVLVVGGLLIDTRGIDALQRKLIQGIKEENSLSLSSDEFPIENAVINFDDKTL
jgi:hypothetical protein